MCPKTNQKLSVRLRFVWFEKKPKSIPLSASNLCSNSFAIYFVHIFTIVDMLHCMYMLHCICCIVSVYSDGYISGSSQIERNIIVLISKGIEKVFIKLFFIMTNYWNNNLSASTWRIYWLKYITNILIKIYFCRLSFVRLSVIIMFVFIVLFISPSHICT